MRMESSPVSFEHLYFVPDIADAADIFDDAAAALNEALTGPADEQVRAEAARLTEVARRGLCDVVIGAVADGSVQYDAAIALLDSLGYEVLDAAEADLTELIEALRDAHHMILKAPHFGSSSDRMVTIIDDPYLLPLCTDDAGVVPAIAVAVLDGDIEYDVMVQVLSLIHI